MKVLILSNFANGLILFRGELITELLAEGYSVVISVPEDGKAQVLKEMGARVIFSSLERRGMNPLRDLKLLAEYLCLLGKEKPDMVLTYTIKPNLYGGLACRLRRIPYLVNITGLGTAIENEGLLAKLLLRFYKAAVKRAACVFFQNSENQTYMQSRGIGVKNGCLLPGSGVNLTAHPYEQYPSEKDGIRILAVLRIMKAKGVEEYFQAVESISRSHPHVSFALVGDYEEESRSRYEPMVRELVDKGILKYYGQIDDVAKVMAQSHIIVHPSYHEGLSNVCLEAAACGRPVLTTNVPGCRETVNENSGLLFEPGSSRSLIQSIERILQLDARGRAQMGAAGRQYVTERFDRDLVIRVYREMIC
ncbi:MAG: glycosyltransferase family 4 protein [Lachnospiraceae bacterium]|nr:glycosyltransferase family 4 protein [Lachnospiraceae bacterium]